MRSVVVVGIVSAGCSDPSSEIVRPASSLVVVSSAVPTSASLASGGDACETAFATRCADAVNAALVAGDDRRAEALAWKGRANAVHACTATADVLDRGARPNAVAARRLYASACARGDRAACRASAHEGSGQSALVGRELDETEGR